jgi:hypothetical protein
VTKKEGVELEGERYVEGQRKSRNGEKVCFDDGRDDGLEKGHPKVDAAAARSSRAKAGLGRSRAISEE